jgi:hypothetical protein
MDDILATVESWIVDRLAIDQKTPSLSVGFPKPVQIRKPNHSVDLVYVCVPGDTDLMAQSRKFTESYARFPPGYKHNTIIVCNGSSPTNEVKSLFLKFPNVRYHVHDNSGWDIGAFLASSKLCSSEIAVCLGTVSYISSGNWMERVVDSWSKYGPGMYGSSASFEVTPHLNTHGFWCSPKWLRTYPFRVTSKEDRYNFEHGKNHRPGGNDQMILWKRIRREGIPVLLVTTDSELEWWDWRKPDNIFRRGDQSNMIFKWRMADVWSSLSGDRKSEESKLADTLTDSDFNTASRTYEWILKVPALPG